MKTGYNVIIFKLLLFEHIYFVNKQRYAKFIVFVQIKEYCNIYLLIKSTEYTNVHTCKYILLIILNLILTFANKTEIIYFLGKLLFPTSRM